MEKVIIGKRDVVILVMTALLCEGHILVEDVPGVGKTMLALAVARSLGCRFSRIQFTPDLLPSDIIGVNIFDQSSGQFQFKPGPILSQVILADEINRGTPKTQSALLECMEERQVTVDGIAHELPRPFLTIATQNPIEYEGTFPLPESQMDRFFIKIHMGYPGEQAENEIITRQQIKHPIEELTQVIDTDELISLQEQTRSVRVDESLRQYIVKVVQGTRRDENLFLGASPRGSLSLFRASQAMALIGGRNFVLPDDIKKMASYTLAHRLISRSDHYRTGDMERIIEKLLDGIPVPQ